MKPSPWIIFIGLGFEILGLILAAVFIGKAIDDHYNLKGLAMTGLTLVVLFSWLFRVVLLAKKMGKNEDNGDL